MWWNIFGLALLSGPGLLRCLMMIVLLQKSLSDYWLPKAPDKDNWYIYIVELYFHEKIARNFFSRSWLYPLAPKQFSFIFNRYIDSETNLKFILSSLCWLKMFYLIKNHQVSSRSTLSWNPKKYNNFVRSGTVIADLTTDPSIWVIILIISDKKSSDTTFLNEGKLYNINWNFSLWIAMSSVSLLLSKYFFATWPG